MARTFKIQLYFMAFCQLLTLISGETLLRCAFGENVHFKCPCCPDELESSRFKKLFKGGYIVLDGDLEVNSKFEFNEHKDHITLKQCDKDDEGIYVWMCGKSNTNKPFHLEILSPGHPDHLKCFIGGDINFESPCPEEVDTCSFKKQSELLDIMHRGIMTLNRKYTSDENKTHITLKGCDEDDEGTYVWMCSKADVRKMFILEINKDAAHLPDDIPISTPSRSSATSPEFLYEMVIKIYLFSYLKTPFPFQDI